jgi:taurine dioxygenase
VAISRIFGCPERHPIAGIRHPEEPLIIVLDNGGIKVDPSDPTAEDIAGSIPWHSDLTYTESPSKGAVLRAVVVPEEGGQTGWIDTARVYAALPDRLKRDLDSLQLVHSFDPAQARRRKAAAPLGSSADDLPELPVFPPVVHPLVHHHPENRETVLNISPFFSRYIPDVPEKEASELYEELVDFATQEEFAYVHDWQPGDLMIWDNRRTMHRAFGCKRKYARVMHRTTLSAD